MVTEAEREAPKTKIDSYPADAISPACGQVKVEIYSEKRARRFQFDFEE